MPFPFRTPASQEDTWEPPDYAKPVAAASSEEWSPPSYATPVGKKKKGPSLFNRAIEALKPAETIKPTGSLIPEAFKTEEMKAIGKKPEPPTSNKWDLRPDGSKKEEGFLGVFKSPEKGYDVSEYSVADSEKLKDEKGNYLNYPTLVPTLTREEVQAVLKAADQGKQGKLPDSVYEKAEAHALERKAKGLPLFANSSESDYTQHMDLARASHYESDEEKAAKKSEEKKGFLSSITDALRSTGAGENARRPREGEKDKKPEDKGFLSSVTNTLRNALRGEESGRKDTSVVGIDQKKLDEIISKLPESMRQPPIRYRDYPKPGDRIPTGEEDPARFLGSLAAPAAEFLTDPLNIAAMGARIGIKAPKSPTGELPIRRSREIPYRMEAPVEAPKPIEPIRPTNKLKTFMKKNPEATMADIEEFIKSVGEAAKPEVPKEIPKVEAPPEPTAAKVEEVPTVEEKKPFVSPFEKKTEKPLEQTFGEFGGVGHPDEPEYANKVLARAGKGEPGLAVEPVEGLDNVNHVVYRNKDGEPIAAAMVVKDQSGKTLVQDLAADKSKGLLTGRAMKALGGKLEELGATESSGTMSADAENFLAKMKERAAKPAKEIESLSEWKPPEYAKPVEAMPGEQRQQLKDLGYTKSQIDRMSPQEATNLANSRMQASKGGWATTEEELKSYGLTHEPEAPKGIATNASSESAASQEAINRQASMKARGEQYVVYDRAGNARPLIGPEAVDYQPRPGETFGIITPTRGFRVLESRGGKIPGRAGLAEFITSESGGMRWEGPVPGGGEIFEGPQGRVLNKLFNALEDAKENVGAQEVLNRQERARRFAAFSGVKEEGAAGAAKSLGKLKGEFAKVQSEALGLNQKESDSLFTAIKGANITAGEKARGYTALFKLMNGEGTPVRSELKILDDVFGNGFADKVVEMHGGLGAVGLKVSKLASTMKSMQNALSLAAPLRHGIGLVYKSEFYPAFKDMFKFFANKEFYNTSMKALEERPNYLLGRDSGLFLAKPGSLQGAEEEFLNSYVGALPGIRNVVGASQRAYTGFLNKLRADVFDSMVKQAEGLGAKMSVGAGDSVEATREARAIAKFINNATGRGDLGSLNKITNELNVMFWSPRMIASRVNMLANPKIYMDLPKGMRLEGLKSLLGIAALGTTIDTLAAYGGAKISSNILSTDFGKSRFGTKLIDPWGGFQQYVVFAARFLAGKTDSQHPQTRLDIGERFIANKLSPVASLVRNILTAKPGSQGKEGPGTFTTQYGQPTSIQKEVAKGFTPIFIQDLQTLAQSEPDWSENVGLTAAIAGASLTGMAQEYPEKKTGKLQFRKMKLKP